jgi:hypothetical protein
MTTRRRGNQAGTTTRRASSKKRAKVQDRPTRNGKSVTGGSVFSDIANAISGAVNTVASRTTRRQRVARA